MTVRLIVLSRPIVAPRAFVASHAFVASRAFRLICVIVASVETQNLASLRGFP